MLRLLLVAVLLAACVAPTQSTVVITVQPPANTLAPSEVAESPSPEPPASPAAGPSPTLPPSPATATPSHLAGRVVVISIDGLRPDALLQADAPNLLGLAGQGAYTWHAQTIFPPVTLPAHASMLTGYTLTGHAITWNDSRPDLGLIGVPTIMSIAHAAGLRTVMIVGKEKFFHYNLPGSVDSYIYATQGDREVADRAVAEITKGFDLMFIHLPNTDYFGHSTGWMSPTQIFEISQTDDQFGRILDALPEDTLLIVSADHGGHGDGHGSNIPEDMTIPWMIAGPGVVAGLELSTKLVTVDTAATVLYALGLSAPQDAVGRPVYEAFGQTPPDLTRGTWSDAAAQSPARSENPAVVVNGLIYVPGGFGGESTFQAYDPGADQWNDLAPLPDGRHHLMSATAGGKVLVFGGAAANSWTPTNTVFEYDPAADQWARKAPMPEPRMSGSAVTIRGRIYVVGGVGGSQALLEYDLTTDSWQSLAALKQPREHFAAVALDGEIYALGGRWSGIGELISVEIYNPLTNEWREGPPLLRPHSGFGATAFNGHIFLAGGEIIMTGDETLAAVEAYDPRTQAWSIATDLPSPLHGEPLAAVGRRLFVLGGSSKAGAIENGGHVFTYSP